MRGRKSGAEEWLGRAVIVPAVIPCGECDACRRGKGTICPNQEMPGSDIHGGFGTHISLVSGSLTAIEVLQYDYTINTR